MKKDFIDKLFTSLIVTAILIIPILAITPRHKQNNIFNIEFLFIFYGSLIFSLFFALILYKVKK